MLFYFALLDSRSLEMFVTPGGDKNGISQASEAISNLRNNKIIPNKLWLQVTSPIGWDKNQIANVKFINDFIRTSNVSLQVF